MLYGTTSHTTNYGSYQYVFIVFPTYFVVTQVTRNMTGEIAIRATEFDLSDHK